MKFGSVDNPEVIDFTLPDDHPDGLKVLQKGKPNSLTEVYVGCAKWNRQDLKGFYPRGTKDELAYYSTQFNSIELNATFYNFYSPEQVAKWRDKTPDNFKFFPKVNQVISHLKRLNNVELLVEEFCESQRSFEDKLGMAFLQLHNNFSPKDIDRLQKVIEDWPADIPLSVELRNTAWFNDASVAKETYDLFEKNNITNIITDTAGRRDLMHMRHTTTTAFVRYVGANHESDYQRLDDWLVRIKKWKEEGLEKLYFFVHQNIEKESPLLSAHFIQKLNQELGYDLKIPATPATQAGLGF
ncbi:DUF72 domain-containing protein [Fulvivirgaceae bacterium BMA10]|uniref:DUF72 domain-containing protein n=1 Tax=Splendidivirga corallicola TaxID=3051826 RepID=A0ABT8KVI4_9BACT|nr:DUF72 domain-containing protein [Fulvivirgaceae bacterium BMA10]